jgi:hypothetical protein
MEIFLQLKKLQTADLKLKIASFDARLVAEAAMSSIASKPARYANGPFSFQRASSSRKLRRLPE